MAILAIDIETTGLDPATGSILEIAARVLDSNLDVLDSFEGVLGLGDKELCQMDDYVSKMHSDNGLMYAAANSTLADFVSWASTYEELIFLGNSVTFDRDWVKHHCPTLNISYRVLDISSIQRLAEFVGAEVPEMGGDAKHRAVSDINACIEQAKFFSSKLKS